MVQAPFSGVVSDVPVTLGDMAMPGRPLVVVHDPSALRITANVAQALMLTSQSPEQTIRYEVMGQGAAKSSAQVQWLPTVDPATHTVQLRITLPVNTTGLVPGMFARVWLPQVSGGRTAGQRVQVPQRAVVRRAEMTGVYVIGIDGKPQLRQIRIGRSVGERIEVLSGLGAGERIVPDPQSAVRAR